MNKTTLTLSFLFTLTPCWAEVSTDGTLGGQALNLPGPNFTIGQDLGNLQGQNLFHSFSHFNLNSAESATFTGDATIQNVISRVSGGEPSSIDGLMKSEIGQAAFYFINPAGIVFGQHAQVDVPGAFYASTANALQFADGGTFNASNPQASSLSMAAPAAFGFLGAQTGSLLVNGANLEFKAGTTVQLSANQINLENAKISRDAANPNGQGLDLQVAAVGNDQQAISVSNLPEHALQGSITSTKSTLDASGNGGAHLLVRAGDVTAQDSNFWGDQTGNRTASTHPGVDFQVNNLTLNNSSVTSDATSSGDAGGVTLNIQKNLQLDNKSAIHSSATASGNAGDVNTKTLGLIMDGGSSIQAYASKTSTGNTGSVNVAAENVQINDKAFILAKTESKGNSGDINVTTGSLWIDGSGSSITSLTTAEGNSGAINVAGDTVNISNGGMLNTQTDGKGNSGNININSSSVELNGNNSNIQTFASKSASGNSGQVNINADNVQIKDSGFVSSQTQGQGNAGDINFSTQNGLTQTNNSSDLPNTSGKGNSQFGNKTVFQINLENSRIGSSSTQTAQGKAGEIRILTKGELSLNNESGIITTTSGQSSSARLNIAANKININGKSKILTISGSQGKAGDISLTANELTMQGSKISLDDNGQPEVFKGQTIRTGSSISSNSLSKGDGGQIYIDIGKIWLTDYSNIATQTSLQGNAGDITINKAASITIDTNSSIASFADNTSSGDLGQVTVTEAGELLISNSGTISSANSGSGKTNQINIQANKISMDSKSSIFSSNGLTDKATESNTKTGAIRVNTDSLTIDDSKISGTTLSLNGAAGDVSITVKDDLSIKNNGNISSDTTGQGNAGNVVVDAKNIRLETSGSITSETFRHVNADSSISSEPLNYGNAGQVSVTAHNNLTLLTQGKIQARTLNSGNGGDVIVNAANIEIKGDLSSINADVVNPNGISINTTGHGGNVKVTSTNQLKLTDGGQIRAMTFAEGNAGAVEVNAETIQIGDQGSTGFSTISSGAQDPSNRPSGTVKGNVGSVHVTATKALEMNHGGIQIDSEVNTDHPENTHLNLITVSAPVINMTNNSDINAKSTGNVPASNISINANDWLFLDNSQITTSVTSTTNGNGGDITLNGDVLIINSGFIQANTTAPLAKGGDINLNIKQLVSAENSLTTGGNTPLKFIPNAGFNVIQAASPTGINGNINISAPQLNIVGALVGLNSPELDLTRIGHDPCSNTMRQSTLKSSSKGGVPLFNKGQDEVTIEPLLDAQAKISSSAISQANQTSKQADCKPKPSEQQAFNF